MDFRTWNWMRMTVLPGVILAAACGTGATDEPGIMPEGESTGEVVDLEYDAQNGRLLRAHLNAVYESRDSGASWQAVPLPASVAQGRIADVATPPGGNKDLLYVAGAGIGVLRSDDAGQTWTVLNEGLPANAVTSFATHAEQPGTLYAFVEDEGIYRSEDSGQAWTRMDAGPGAAITEFVHSDMEGSMQSGWLFAVTDEGVRRSMDCFCGWRPTGDLPAGRIHDVAYDPQDPKRVYVAAAGGLYLSDDGGESWEAVADGPRGAKALALDGSGTIFVTGGDGAMLRSGKGGRSWETVGA